MRPLAIPVYISIALTAYKEYHSEDEENNSNEIPTNIEPPV